MAIGVALALKAKAIEQYLRDSGNYEYSLTAATRDASPLFCASWIDKGGSAPGNDLGIWIGGEEENRARNSIATGSLRGAYQAGCSRLVSGNSLLHVGSM